MAKETIETPKKKAVKTENKKLAELEAKVKDLEAQLAAEKDSYVRLLAEFETSKRRNSEDKLNLVSTASAETIKGLLPTLDDCERAISILKNSADEAAIEGTSLIYDKLISYLKTKGLSIIEAKGQQFDTDFHEAVTLFPAPSEDMKGVVIDVVQTGYTLNGKVIRYAKVVVGS